MTRRVLVTGAAGNLGRKAIGALADIDGVDLVGIDHRPAPDLDNDVDFLNVDFLNADLATFDSAWAERFRQVDVVLHLAANPHPTATWDDVVHSNVDLSVHVLRAAEEGGVDRFVFASSTWVLGGHRFTTEALTPATAPHPVNAYGASKLMVERLSRAAYERSGMSCLALRLGWCQPGENVPGPHMTLGRWGQESWLSNDDWRQAAALACTTDFDGVEVVNVVSDNAGMRWDLAAAERVLGYRPRSRHVPQLDVRARLADRWAGWGARSGLADGWWKL